jgi:type II secretory ATPase GspE/PulE/Tfp pilus assembly ATPase PilB-like protein
MADPPIVELTNFILVAAIKKGATTVRIEPGFEAVAEESVVVFVIGGAEHVELRPPALLHPHIVRRLSIMASLPQYPKGSGAEGVIQLAVGPHDQRVWFSIRVTGHGAGLRAELVRIAGADLEQRERL